MTVFLACAALLTVLLVAWLLRPLLTASHPITVSSERLNAAIHNDLLRTLEADLARGAINQSDFDDACDELQLRLLDDTQPALAPATPVAVRRSKGLAWGVGVGVPVLAAALYLQLGSPQAINPPGPVTQAQIDDMVKTLAQKLEKNPDNPQGWAMLARSYKVMGRLEQAKAAFEKSTAYLEQDADALVDYAELLGQLANNNLAGKPSQLLEQALQKNPDHPNALMLAGIADYQQSHFKLAAKRWEQLLALMDPASADAQQMRDNINQARSKAGMPPLAGADKLPPVPAGAAAGMTPEKINEMVDRLAKRLKDNPTDYAGWARLANAYRVQNRLDEADSAYQKTGPLLKSDPELMLRYADFLATRAQGNFKGRATELIQAALVLNPNHPMGLMLAGQAAFQAGAFTQAIGHWEKVLQTMPADAPDRAQVQQEIAMARAKQEQK
jgi:cytochrome c-type biogenesis protein CcmH